VPFSPCGKKQWLYTQLGQVRDSISSMDAILGTESPEDYQQREQAELKDATTQFMDLVRQRPDCTTLTFQAGAGQRCQDLEQTVKVLDSEWMLIADAHQSLLNSQSHMRTALRGEMEALRADIE
jgi:hypothetical protein